MFACGTCAYGWKVFRKSFLKDPSSNLSEFRTQPLNAMSFEDRTAWSFVGRKDASEIYGMKGEDADTVQTYTWYHYNTKSTYLLMYLVYTFSLQFSNLNWSSKYSFCFIYWHHTIHDTPELRQEHHNSILSVLKR